MVGSIKEWERPQLDYEAGLKKAMQEMNEHNDITWVSEPVPNADGTDECDDTRESDIVYVSDTVWFDEEPGTMYGGGWSSSYYEIPEDTTELQDLIEHKGMNFSVGNIFKAAYRMEDKGGAAYNLRKIIWFAERELRRIENEDRPGNSTS